MMEKNNQEVLNNTNINWFPGHMNKAKREISEKLKLVDMVIIILDARCPKSSYNPDFDVLFKNKPKLFLLNKSRLADSKETKKWLNYYNGKDKKSLDIDAVSGFNVNKIVSYCNQVLKDKNEKKESQGLKKRAIRTLICGIPNVGKSTLINTLAKKKSAKTGDKPGVTKALQWIKLNDNLEMLDTPGILWPKFENQTIALNLALTNAIKEEILPIEEICYYGIDFFNKYYKVRFIERYKLDQNIDLSNHVEVINQIAIKRGCINKNGPDFDRTIKLIFNEMKSNLFNGVTYDRFI